MATSLGDGKFWIQTSCTLLKKLILCHTCCLWWRGWVSTYTDLASEHLQTLMFGIFPSGDYLFHEDNATFPSCIGDTITYSKSLLQTIEILFFLVYMTCTFNNFWRCMGHITDLTKFFAASPNKHISVMDSPETLLDRYVYAMTPAPTKLHAMLHSCCNSGEVKSYTLSFSNIIALSHLLSFA